MMHEIPMDFAEAPRQNVICMTTIMKFFFSLIRCLVYCLLLFFFGVTDHIFYRITPCPLSTFYLANYEANFSPLPQVTIQDWYNIMCSKASSVLKRARYKIQKVHQFMPDPDFFFVAHPTLKIPSSPWNELKKLVINFYTKKMQMGRLM